MRSLPASSVILNVESVFWLSVSRVLPSGEVDLKVSFHGFDCSFSISARTSGGTSSREWYSCCWPCSSVVLMVTVCSTWTIGRAGLLAVRNRDRNLCHHPWGAMPTKHFGQNAAVCSTGFPQFGQFIILPHSSTVA